MSVVDLGDAPQVHDMDVSEQAVTFMPTYSGAWPSCSCS